MDFQRLHMTSRILTLLILCCCLQTELNAQELHYTQWINATQNFNPGLTGEFEQQVRGTIQHKRQWQSVGTGYQTNTLDAQYKMLNYATNNYIGFGLLVNQDKAGKSDFRFFNVMASTAFHLVANRKNLLSSGLQLGYIQRSIDLTGLSWDSQYNGLAYDPSLDDKEKILTNKDANLDIGAGISWKHKGRKKYQLGYAMRHIAQQVTFISRGDDKLRIRQTWHGSLWKSYEFFTVRYDALVQRQAGAMEIVTGITFDSRLGLDSKYTNNKTSNSVKGGMMWRYKDAIHPFIGFELRHFVEATVGFDIRTGKMPGVNSFMGGPEISLSYLGTFERRRMKLIK